MRAIVAGLVLAVAIWVVRGQRRTLFSHACFPACLRCGYSMYGHAVGSVCPECGAAETVERASRGRWLLLSLRALVWIAAVGAIGVLLQPWAAEYVFPKQHEVTGSFWVGRPVSREYGSAMIRFSGESWSIGRYDPSSCRPSTVALLVTGGFVLSETEDGRRKVETRGTAAVVVRFQSTGSDLYSRLGWHVPNYQVERPQEVRPALQSLFKDIGVPMGGVSEGELDFLEQSILLCRDGVRVANARANSPNDYFTGAGELSATVTTNMMYPNALYVYWSLFSAAILLGLAILAKLALIE